MRKTTHPGRKQRLTLRKEVLRTLSAEELDAVAAGRANCWYSLAVDLGGPPVDVKVP
jgi:hypothetical protein